jgi:5-methylcytosine-specific restriction endonuclease McrA
MKPKATQRKTLDAMKLQELIPVLDRSFSLYRRLCEAEFSCGYLTCVTCGKTLHYKEMDVGHFISRRKLAVRWDVLNTVPQCPECNRLHDGRREVIRAYILSRHGPGVLTQLEERAKVLRTVDRDSARRDIIFFRERIRQLLPMVEQANT